MQINVLTVFVDTHAVLLGEFQLLALLTFEALGFDLATEGEADGEIGEELFSKGEDYHEQQTIMSIKNIIISIQDLS